MLIVPDKVSKDLDFFFSPINIGIFSMFLIIFNPSSTTKLIMIFWQNKSRDKHYMSFIVTLFLKLGPTGTMNGNVACYRTVSGNFSAMDSEDKPHFHIT